MIGLFSDELRWTETDLPFHEATVARLESLMRSNPEADSWQLVYFTVWGSSFFEEDLASCARRKPRWSTSWGTFAQDSAAERLTVPPDRLAALDAFLNELQAAHCEAVGGPLDGIYYYFVCRRTETRLSLLY